jgi:hypothetical protein
MPGLRTRINLHDSTVTFKVTLSSLITRHCAPFSKQVSHKANMTAFSQDYFASLTHIIHANRNSHYYPPTAIFPHCWIKHVAKTYPGPCVRALYACFSVQCCLEPHRFASCFCLWHQVKVEQSQSITKGALCGNGDTVSLILNLAASWGWVVSFTPRPLYPR